MSVSVGKALRSARESKNIPLSKVSDDLHIRITYLQAIENGRPEILPSPVQGRGFVRMYSDYLKLDTEKILYAWDHPDIPFSLDSEIPNQTESPAPQERIIEKTESSPQPSKTDTVNSQNADPVSAIYKQIGSELRQRREILGLSYEDAEKHTLVRSIYLKLIEDGNFDSLPSSVQARGMLNNYAAFLNLDVDHIMLQYANALQLKSASRIAETVKEKKNKKEPKPTKKAGKFRQFMTPDLFVGVSVLIAMFAIIIYSAVTISEYKAKAVQKTVDLNLNFINQLATHEITATATSVSNLTPTVPISEINPSEPTLINTQSESLAIEETNQPVQIFVEANQRTFMKVVADGDVVFIGRTLPGNTYPFDASQMIEVTTGNAAALKITYNQQSLGLMGKLGEVITLQFTNNAIMTPTPAITMTPTLTIEPTYTPQIFEATPTFTITPYIP